MGIAHGRTSKSAPTPKRKPGERIPFPIIFFVALPLFVVLDLYGTRDYDTSVVSACIAAVLEAGAAWLWLGGLSKSDFEMYIWPRMLFLGVATAVVVPIAFFLVGWPLLTSVMISVGVALAAGIAIMVITDL